MDRQTAKRVTYQVIEFDGIRYAIVQERLLTALCRRADALPALTPCAVHPAAAPERDTFDATRLARRLIQRRRRAGLTQVELARRAGVRVETLNRIERGRTEPDFATIRKLVTAMNLVEARAGTAWPADAPEQ